MYKLYNIMVIIILLKAFMQEILENPLIWKKQVMCKVTNVNLDLIDFKSRNLHKLLSFMSRIYF